MINTKELKKQINELKVEKDEILFNKRYYGLEAEHAAIAVSDIEYKIACLEDQLDFENRMIPFKMALYGFVVVSLGLLLYAYIASPY